MRESVVLVKFIKLIIFHGKLCIQYVTQSDIPHDDKKLEEL